MTSRESILNAVAHTESDKIPLDLGSTPSSGISAIAYNNLKKELNITDGGTKVYDVVQQVVEVEDSIIDMFGVDVIDIGRTFNTEPSDWKEVSLADGSKALYPSWFKYEEKPNGDFEYFDEDGDKLAKMPVGATFFDQTYFPYLDDYPTDYKDLDKMMDKVLWKKLGHSPWDNASKPDFYKTLRKNALHLKETTDKALMLVCGCNLFEWGTFLRRIDNFLMDIYTDQDLVEGLLDQLVERHLATLKDVCESVGDVVDIIRLGDDLGMDSGMFMSREKYVDIFKPRQKIMLDYIKKNSSMKTFLHSCGSVEPIIGDLIEVGFDILNPVQTTARDMEPEHLKKTFGKDITFWGGGCNTREVLNRGTPQEVYDYVRKTIDILAPGGGFVFNQEHNIMPDVPAQNIIAMYKAVNEYK